MITCYLIGAVLTAVLVLVVFPRCQGCRRPVHEDVVAGIGMALLWPVAVVFSLLLWCIATLAPCGWLRRLDRLDDSRRQPR